VVRGSREAAPPAANHGRSPNGRFGGTTFAHQELYELETCRNVCGRVRRPQPMPDCRPRTSPASSLITSGLDRHSTSARPSIAILPNGDTSASQINFRAEDKRARVCAHRVFRRRPWQKPGRRFPEDPWRVLVQLCSSRRALSARSRPASRQHPHSPFHGPRRDVDAPTNNTNGLLRDNGEYHCAPMPVIEHAGRPLARV